MYGLNIDGVFDFLAIVGWLITIFLLSKAFYRSMKEHGVKETFTLKRGGWLLSRKTVLSITLSVIITLIAMAIVFVQPQENAVVVSALSPNGIRPRPLDSGLHVVVPFLERAVRYPIYNQSFSISRSGFERGEPGVDDSISARSKEGQEVFMDATLIFRIDPNRLNELHIAWQERYLEQLVRPVVRSFVRGRASQLTVEEIYSSQRFELEAAILASLRTRLERHGIVADAFVIRDVSFKDDYATAVEAKVITEQEALRADIAIRTKTNQAEQIRQLAQGEADAVVIKAQADAQALQLVNRVLQDNPQVINYEYIKRLAPNVKLLMIDSRNPVILPLTTELTGGEAVTTNPLIPQMPSSGLAPDGNVLEPQMPPSGMAPDEEAMAAPATSATDILTDGSPMLATDRNEAAVPASK